MAVEAEVEEIIGDNAFTLEEEQLIDGGDLLPRAVNGEHFTKRHKQHVVRERTVARHRVDVADSGGNYAQGNVRRKIVQLTSARIPYYGGLYSEFLPIGRILLPWSCSFEGRELTRD